MLFYKVLNINAQNITFSYECDGYQGWHNGVMHSASRKWTPLTLLKCLNCVNKKRNIG